MNQCQLKTDGKGVRRKPIGERSWYRKMLLDLDRSEVAKAERRGTMAKAKGKAGIKEKLKKLAGKGKKESKKAKEEEAEEEEDAESCFGVAYSPEAKECKRCTDRKECAKAFKASQEPEEEEVEEEPKKKPKPKAKVKPKAKPTPKAKKPAGPKKKPASELDRDVVRTALLKGGTLKQVAEASYKEAKKTWERRVEIQLWSFGLGFGLEKGKEVLQKTSRAGKTFYKIVKAKK